MYNDLIRQIKLSLHLEKEPVGIRFFLIREEYDEINNVIESKNKKSICTYINECISSSVFPKNRKEKFPILGIGYSHISAGNIFI